MCGAAGCLEGEGGGGIWQRRPGVVFLPQCRSPLAPWKGTVVFGEYPFPTPQAVRLAEEAISLRLSGPLDAKVGKWNINHAKHKAA